MSIKYAKTAQNPNKGGHKRHYCPEHDELCEIVIVEPRRRTEYRCPQGCRLSRRQVTLK
jgi:hypothetical protein